MAPVEASPERTPTPHKKEKPHSWDFYGTLSRLLMGPNLKAQGPKVGLKRSTSKVTSGSRDSSDYGFLEDYWQNTPRGSSSGSSSGGGGSSRKRFSVAEPCSWRKEAFPPSLVAPKSLPYLPASELGGLGLPGSRRPIVCPVETSEQSAGTAGTVAPLPPTAEPNANRVRPRRWRSVASLLRPPQLSSGRPTSFAAGNNARVPGPSETFYLLDDYLCPHNEKGRDTKTRSQFDLSACQFDTNRWKRSVIQNGRSVLKNGRHQTSPSLPPRAPTPEPPEPPLGFKGVAERENFLFPRLILSRSHGERSTADRREGHSRPS
ncbi:unnamed protein product, partial [Darwinula stevensoni]